MHFLAKFKFVCKIIRKADPSRYMYMQLVTMVAEVQKRKFRPRRHASQQTT